MAMPAATDGATRDNVATAIGILRQRFADRLQTGAEIRRQHANTITWIPNQPPDAVIWVENAEEVRNVVDVARTHRVPIIADEHLIVPYKLPCVVHQSWGRK
jgi:D-lactate dehydrogenase (cytochrome)